MSWTLAFTTPDGTNTLRVVPVEVDLPEAEVDEGAIFSATFESNYTAWLDETDATNPGQTRAYVVATRGSQVLFRGLIRTVWREEQADGSYEIKVEADDKYTLLNNTLAGYDGATIFTLNQVETAQTTITFVAGVATDDSAYPYYPSPGHGDCYLPTTGGAAVPNVELDADVNDSVTTIVATATTESSIAPEGYCKLGTEVFHYTGWHKDPTNSNKYTFRGCTRGALGTTATSHTAGATIYQQIPKSITAGGPVKVWGNVSGASWEPIGEGQYTVQQMAGRIDLKGDPLAAPYNDGSGYLGVHVDYTVCDEDDGAALTLEDVVTDIFGYSGTGGPALGSGDIDIDVPYIALTRQQVSQTNFTWPVIKQLITELELDRYNSASAIGTWYDATNDKYCVKSIAQSATPDYVIHNAAEISDTTSVDNLYSAVILGWSGIGPDLASPTRMWHPDRGDSVGGEAVTAFVYQLVDREMGVGWDEDTSSSGNSVRTHLLTDGNSNSSGIGLQFADIPSSGMVLYAWTPSAETRVIDEIEVVIDVGRFIRNTSLKVEVLGYTSYTPGDPPTATGEITLSDALVFEMHLNTGPSAGGPVNRVAHGGRFGDGIYQGAAL